MTVYWGFLPILLNKFALDDIQEFINLYINNRLEVYENLLINFQID